MNLRHLITAMTATVERVVCESDRPVSSRDVLSLMSVTCAAYGEQRLAEAITSALLATAITDERGQRNVRVDWLRSQIQQKETA